MVTMQLGVSHAESGVCLHTPCNGSPCTRRGIDVVRNKIKMFSQKKVTLPPGRHKVVILDEADRCECVMGGDHV